VNASRPRRGEVWWASLPRPLGSGPGYRRPVLVIQSNPFNESCIRTVVVVAITSNTRLGSAPGNVLCQARDTGLPRDSVAWIAGANTKVIEIVLDKIAHGWSPEEMHLQHPHLSLAQIHSALAYYYEFKETLDRQIERELHEAEELTAQASDPSFRKKLLELKNARCVSASTWTFMSHIRSRYSIYPHL
jgi:mRNA interferase MazF